MYLFGMLKIRELKLRKWLVSITAIRQANSNLSVSQAQTVRHTITYLIKSIIETAGMRIGVIGTNQNITGDKVLVTQSTTPTTPNALELQQLFAEMVDSDAECVVMEVSSHALELERVHGCHFDVGVFTNLTRDHLDFHKTMENYLNAKAKLFKISDKGVVNFDDDGGKRLLQTMTAIY